MRLHVSDGRELLDAVRRDEDPADHDGASLGGEARQQTGEARLDELRLDLPVLRDRIREIDVEQPELRSGQDADWAEVALHGSS